MKEKIRDKATDMFLNFGFKSITMDDIANAMGISKKTIYSEYSNKTALVEDCVMGKFCSMSDGINDITAQEKNPIEELFEIKKYVLSHLKDEKSSPQYQLMKYYPRIYNKLKEMQYEMMQHCVTSNIERGMEQGLYRPNLHVEFISKIYFAGMNSIKDQTMFPIDRFPAIFLMEAYLEYHLRAIVSPDGRKKLNEIINSNHQ